jgi:L-ascorbate 6-phosphate lactonase
MMTSHMVEYMHLGQSGFRFKINELIVYIDPYLSDSIERIEGSRLKRQVPIEIQPNKIDDANYVLITHIHLDHCDLDTLIPLSVASPLCKFIAPNIVCNYLSEMGFPKDRLICAVDSWISIGTGIRVHATPAAHPVIAYDYAGFMECVGYIIEVLGKNLIYHSGDTFLVDELVTALNKFTPIDVVMLPINEHNYFKEKLGILGNMSLREAFGLAQLLNVSRMVPMHWDLFKDNSLSADEIMLYYKYLQPSFDLSMEPLQYIE